MDRHKQLVVIRVFDQQEISFHPFNAPLHQAGEATDTVIHVYDPIAGLQIGVGNFRAGVAPGRASGAASARSQPKISLSVSRYSTLPSG